MHLAPSSTALLHLLLALLAIHPTLAKRFTKANDAVLLSNIQSLTFQSPGQTTSRRLAPIPQLKCVGGAGCAHFTPPAIRCRNAGSSYGAADVEWTCTAPLPPEFKLGATDVVCEGYDNADDEFVLKGSCGLEYRLLLTDAGEERFGGSSWYTWGSDQKRHDVDGGGIAGTLFWVVFVGIAGWILWGFVKALFGGNRQLGRPPVAGGRGGWFGGGGDDDGNDPPPPYSPQPPRKPKTSTSTGTRGRREQSWQPGFWSGAAAGAAGATAANYLSGGRRQPQRDAGEGSSRSAWFGGGGGGSGSGSAPSRSGVSESRYESTGFGGTRRR